MNVEIGAEAALFPEKEYIKGIFVAVCERSEWYKCSPNLTLLPWGIVLILTDIWLLLL